ncbi:zinc finger, CCHC-type containing protein [Tanacetum coccineum]
MTNPDSVKDLYKTFEKLDKFSGQDFRRWQKKMHFYLTNLKVVYVLSTPCPMAVENETLEQTRNRSKWENADYICRGHILNGMSDSLFDVYQNVESAKELWDSLESKYMAEDASSKKFLVGQFAQYGMKMDESISVSSIIDKLPPSWKDFKNNLKHKKEELNLVELGSHFQIEQSIRDMERGSVGGTKTMPGSSVNMVEEGESSKAGKGKRKFQGSNNKSSDKKPKITCWKSGKGGGKGKNEAGSSGSKDPGKQSGLFLVPTDHSVENYYVSIISETFYVQDDDISWWVDSGATCHVCKNLQWFKDFKPIEDGSMLKMGNVATEPIKGLGSVNLVFTSGNSLLLNNVVYVPGIRKNLVSGIVLNNNGYKQVMESDKYILSRHGNFIGFGYLNGMFKLNLDVSFIKNSVCMASTSSSNNCGKSKLWHARLGHVHYKRLIDMSKLSLIPAFELNGEKCKTPNDYVSVHYVIDSRDADFGNEDRFTSLPKPADMTASSSNFGTSDQVTDTPPEPSEARRSVRARKAKSFGDDFQLYLVEGSRNEIDFLYQYCFNIDEDPRTYSEAMASRDAGFWKEAIQDEMDSIMHNNTWKLADLPPGCKPLGSKWIFKRKMKVDGSIDKYKARLVIQGFRQKEGIDFFDTYAPVARITTIRLLLALAAIHNLVIHQMDVKTAFLNGELDEEIYMKQPEGFVMPGNDNKVCKLVKSLYGLKQAPKQWHQKFDDVVLSNGFALNQADKCVYSKFDASGKGVIICLYVDDMLIFGTNQDQVDITKEFLSSKFDMKDMGEADVILGVKIIRGEHGITISQSHYIEKMLDKFNLKDCSPIGTPMDPTTKLVPNKGVAVNQLEYSKAIGSLMYAMISTRPDIAFAVGKLSRYTHNPSLIHWKAINRVFQYLKGTMDYGLTYTGFPSVLEGYSDFVALAAAGKEAEWLRNLIYEIPLWPKPISPISIRCDSAATLAKAYSQVYNDTQFPPSMTLGAEFNVEGLIFRDWNTLEELSRVTYVSMKFSLFKKLGLGFDMLMKDKDIGSDPQTEVAKLSRLPKPPRQTLTPPQSYTHLDDFEDSDFIVVQHHREIILKLDPSDHVSTSVMIRNIPNVNAARPMSYLSKMAHSTVKRSIHKNAAFKNSNFHQRVNTVKDNNVNTTTQKQPQLVGLVLDHVSKHNSASITLKKFDYVDAQGNMSYLTDYEEIDRGYVAFGGNSKGGKLIGKGTIKIGNLDFENVYFIRELKFNLFSVSQMCDKKNSVHFNDTECIVLFQNFKLTDESQVLLKVLRKNNMYSVDLKNIIPKGGLTCLFAKATSNESKLWHRRLGHINFKTMNKLIKGNLVRGLLSKLLENNQTCVACQKGKQHKASCKSKTVSSINQLLHMLHMNLFGPTFVKSLMKKMYCLVVTDDYSRFSWVFFLATKDETSGILKSFITKVENLIDQRVKVIRCDNRTEFTNKEMNQFCKRKGIKREFSVARTPQQFGVAKRKNRTLIEAARTMLANSKLPTTFWADSNTACYVQNRV